MTERTEIRTGDGALVATHDPVSAMHAALAAFQAAMPTVYKGNTARIPGKDGGPGFSYTYADLGDVTAAAMPLLTAHGLAFSCCPRATDKGGYELVGVLTHSAGYAMEGALPLFGNNPQQIGGAITYARRYLLGCMTGIVTDEDDDGASSSGERTQAAPPPYYGPSTADLLTTLDELARANGESYAGVVAPYIKTRGISVDDLEREPARNLHPFVEHIARYYRDNPGKPEGVDDREGASTEGGAST